MSILEQIQAYIVENFLLGVPTELDRGASLIGTGIVDSTGIMELVLFIEETWGFQVRDEEMLPENLDTLDNITRFVQCRLAERSAVVPQAGVR
ncbi:MAG: acyl carrier protein [Planctomycetota bacterium]